MRQSDDRAEANAESRDQGELETSAQDEPRLPAILSEEPERSIENQKQGAEVEMERGYHSHQGDGQNKQKPSALLDDQLRSEQDRGERDHLVREGIPATSDAHEGRERKQQRTQQRSRRFQAAQLKKAEKEQTTQKNFAQMLKDQRPGNPIAGEPADRLPDEKTCSIGQVLTHPHVERP